MTKEEAIKVLENTPIAPTYGYSFNDISDAIYIAIEALQTPPISQRSMYQAGYKQGKEDAIQNMKEGSIDGCNNKK